MPSRGAPWWMFIVAASFLAYVSLSLYQYFWGPSPFLGADLAFVGGKGMVVVATRQPGLQPGDRILAVDGQTIRNAHDWNAIRANTEVGRTPRSMATPSNRRAHRRGPPARGFGSDTPRIEPDTNRALETPARLPLSSCNGRPYQKRA